MKNANLYTVSAIVDQACDDYQDFGKHRYGQFLGWALWGARELHFDAGHKVERCYLELDSLKTAPFPCNFVDWVKIAVQCGDKMVAIGRSRDLAMINREDPITGELIPNAPANVSDYASTGIQTNNYNGLWYARAGSDV